MGVRQRRPTRPRESRYVVGWSAVIAVLALAGGVTLFGLVRSSEAPQGQVVAGLPGILPPSSQAPTGKARPAPTPPKPPPTNPAMTVSVPATPRFQGVQMLSPEPGQRVRGQEGVTISGTAGDLAGRRLRIFDLAAGIYYLVDDGGIEVGTDGRWSLHYRGIGYGPMDVGRTFVLTAVLADSECERALAREIEEDRDDDGIGRRPDFHRLPDGCRIADQVAVVKVAP